MTASASLDLELDVATLYDAALGAGKPTGADLRGRFSDGGEPEA